MQLGVRFGLQRYNQQQCFLSLLLCARELPKASFRHQWSVSAPLLPQLMVKCNSLDYILRFQGATQALSRVAFMPIWKSSGSPLSWIPFSAEILFTCTPSVKRKNVVDRKRFDEIRQHSAFLFSCKSQHKSQAHAIVSSVSHDILVELSSIFFHVVSAKLLKN